MVSEALKRAQTKYRLKNKDNFCEYSRSCYRRDPETRKRTLTIYRLKQGQKVKNATLEKYGLTRSDYNEKPLKEPEYELITNTVPGRETEITDFTKTKNHLKNPNTN